MPSPLIDPFLTQALYGDPVLIGTITATATLDNSNTAVPFANTGELLKGKTLYLQGDAAFYFKQNTTAAAGVTTAGLQIGLSGSTANWYVSMRSFKGYLSILPVSGTVNVKVFEMNG